MEIWMQVVQVKKNYRATANFEGSLTVEPQ